MARQYEDTHPWISFSADLTKLLNPQDWMRLGGAEVACGHIASTPLMSEISEEMLVMYLVKGVRATTAIEGNTLSESQVRAAVEGTLQLPPSQEYLKQEVDNVIGACNLLAGQIEAGGLESLSPELICRYNAQVLKGLRLEERVVAGRVREHSVSVGNYRGAPAEDCDYLLGELCDWLEGPDFEVGVGDPFGFVRVVLKAMLAHLYIAWIHPFGDGNGRTARLLELHCLLDGGLPSPAAHLLANHFNTTRTEYYRVLDSSTRRTPPGPAEFLSYAIAGFFDGLQEQLHWIQEQQLRLAWEHLVRERLERRDTPAGRRQIQLLLALNPSRSTPRAEVTDISPEVIRAYADKTAKTLSRDLNALEKLGLIVRDNEGIRPSTAQLHALIP